MTTQELRDSIIAKFEAKFSNLLPQSWLYIVATVWAAMLITLYKYSGFMLLQQFVTTASYSFTEIGTKRIRPLVEWGQLVGAGDPQFATQAEHTVSVTVLTNDTSSISAGTQLIYPETQLVFSVIASTLWPGVGTYAVGVRATGDQAGTFGAGIQGNLPVDTELKFITPLAGVDDTAPIASQTVEGVNEESEADYRQRVIDYFQKPPRGGSYADYEAWAESVEGVFNSYPYANLPGRVKVYIEADVAIDPDGIATPALITATNDYIETVRPAGTITSVASIIRNVLDVEISGITQADNLTGLQASLEDAVDEYFRKAEPYIPGTTIQADRNDIVSLGGLGGVIQATVSSYGAVFGSYKLLFAAVSLPSYQLPEGTKVKLGTITYV